MPDIDSNISNLEAFEQAGREIFGEHSCYPMVAYGKTKALSAFKLLARARDLDFETSNIVSKQIQNYELDRKHAIENNQDDPDYNVDDDVHIEDYVDKQYIQLIEDSKQYRNIVVSLSPHPCGHIVYHEDLRRMIGIVRTKAKTGSKEAVYCAYIDGGTADKAGWCKSDLLRVDVVKVINDTFKAIGRPVMSADELLAEVDKHPEIWDLYAKGYTMGLNQCEKQKTTERVMQFKPRNTVELSAFVAAIRPGAKSLVDDFVSRRFHNYGIPAMDELLKLYGATGVTGESSFLFYDEQIMTLAKAAGIDPADANALIKHIKKKHLPEVASYKERFIPGFISYLETEQHVDRALAEKTAQDVWTVILASASYLFNASHAYAYCIDSLYGAYLKNIAPYEFYTVLLKLYTEKGNKEKIALIVNEMKRYQNIQMTPGKFGQDNRDWYIDKEHKTISQSLSSIKFMSQLAADDLFTLGQRTFDSFTALLRTLQTETCVKKNQIELLIRLGYFSDFGGSAKLLQVFNEFNEGKNRLTKTLSEKSVTARTQALIQMETSLSDDDISIADQLRAEQEYMCICLSCDPFSDSNLYFVQEVDDQYGIKVKLYNLRRGKSGVAKIRKDLYKSRPLSAGQIMCLDGWKEQRRCTYKDGQRVELDVSDIWATSYHIIKEEE